MSSLIKDLSARRNDHVIYETSVVTHLMKDALGGDSLTVGIFNVQNGDAKGTSLTLNFLKYVRNIFNWPIVSDAKKMGLLKKYRAEVNAAKNNRLNGSMMEGGQDPMFPQGGAYGDKG